MSGRALSTTGAALLIARLTWARLVRGRLLWLSFFFALVPLLLPLFETTSEPGIHQWREIFDVTLALLAVIPGLHLAPAIGEEVEDKTFTYLWSRPFPRVSLLLGKLLTLLPIIALLLCAMIAGQFLMLFGSRTGELSALLTDSIVAMALGTMAASATCVGLGTLLPRFSTAISIIYLLFIDKGLGEMPFTIHNLAITHHVRELALRSGTHGGDVATGIGWLAGISAVWLAVAAWRITVTEYATDK